MIMSSTPSPVAPFQSTLLTALKRTTWFSHQRPPDQPRHSGLLIVSPVHGCLYVSEPHTMATQMKGARSRPKGAIRGPRGPRGPRIAQIRIRLDPHHLTDGPTIFIATLSPALRQLWIEDTVLWKGRRLTGEDCLRDRLVKAAQWLEHGCWPEGTALELRVAPWTSLASIKPEGVWRLQEDVSTGPLRRYYWSEPIPTPAPPVTPVVAQRQAETETPSVTPALAAHTVAIATRDTIPEQWFLTSSKGDNLGRAFIRTLAMSELMHPHKNPVRVRIIWNDMFNKWEIVGLV